MAQSHVKTERCYTCFLKHRQNLKRKFFDLENAVRRALKSLGARATHLGGSEPPAAIYLSAPDRKAERVASHIEYFNGPL